MASLFARTAASVTLLGVGLAVAAPTAVYLQQERLLFPGAYLPDDPAARTATAQRHGIDEQLLTTPSGDRILTWHHPSAGERFVLFVGGNAQRVETTVPLGEVLGDHGWDLFVVGPRGFPGSEGQPSQHAFEADLHTAWRHLTQTVGLPPDHIVLHGRSMGGGIVGLVLDDVRPAGVIMESTYDAIAPLAAAAYPWLPVEGLLKHPFPTVDVAPQVQAPVFQVHGTANHVVPIERGRSLSAAWPTVEWVEVEGAGHDRSLLLADPDTRVAWLAFLDRAVPQVTGTTQGVATP